MSATFRPYGPDRIPLSASDTPDQLPEGCFLRVTSAIWRTGPSLTVFYAPYEGGDRRNAPYGDRMMVRVLP